MTLFTWSKTASNNATADATINWAEGQSPSSVNDSARASMAAVAKFRDDNSGSITTGGTSTAYTATSNQVFTSLALLDKQQITIVPNVTSGAAPTLNVDSLGAKAINGATTVAVATGALVAGTPYRLTYYNATNEFILEGAIAAMAGNLAIGGTLTVTGAATFSSTLSVTGKVTLTSTDSMAAPKGTTAQRNGSATEGDVRYNSTLHGVEFYNGTAWITLGQTPNVQVFTSGSSQTYTTPVGALYLRVRMIGGGGGGGAENTNNGSNGTDTSFGSWTAKAGSGGLNNGGNGGAGGTGGANGTGFVITRTDGGNGSIGSLSGASNDIGMGGIGGSSPFGGAGVATTSAALAAKANTGSGGGGGGAQLNANGGGGGGAGEYLEALIAAPATTYTYTVGAGGNGGAAGGLAGGNGAAGRIEVTAYFQ
jgi:hypothetical protein